jgi:hypothetical protein
MSLPHSKDVTIIGSSITYVGNLTNAVQGIYPLHKFRRKAQQMPPIAIIRGPATASSNQLCSQHEPAELRLHNTVSDPYPTRAPCL